MKKQLLFLALAPLALSTAPVEAQPAVAWVEPSEEAASQLLDQAAAAYRGLDGLAMKYVSYDSEGGQRARQEGTIQFEKSGAARLTSSTEGDLLVMGAASQAQLGKMALVRAMQSIPGAASIPLPALVQGESPVNGKNGLPSEWSGTRLLPGGGVGASLRAWSPLQPGGYQIAFSFYFDEVDHLLRRVEAKTQFKGQSYSAVTTFSDVQINPQFAPDTFQVQSAQVQFAVPPKIAPSEEIYWDPKLQVGAAPFVFQGADLSKYRGKVVLLDFWAMWCGPCVEELPNVQSNYRKYHAKGFEVIGISLDEDKGALSSFVKARKMPWPQIFDGKGWKTPNAIRYGVKGIPFTLLIGKDGKIAAIDASGEELEPAIKRALAK